MTLAPAHSRSRAKQVVSDCRGRLRRGLVLIAAVAASAAPVRARDLGCDRVCLGGVLDRYLSAIFSHSPATAPIATDLKATENGRPLALGQGAWRTITGYGALQRRYFDPKTAQAAYFGLLLEGGEPVIASLRLTIVEGRVTESEWTIARRSAGGLFSPEGLLADPPPQAPIPSAERVSRAKMVATADAYFQGLQDHDGARVPAIPGCERVENGVRVTHRRGPPPPLPGTAPPPGGNARQGPEQLSGDCTANFQMFSHSIAATSRRRYPLVDEEAGVVMAMTLFHRPPGSPMKRNLLTEFFAERGGRLFFAFAAMFYLDADAPDTSGWD